MQIQSLHNFKKPPLPLKQVISNILMDCLRRCGGELQPTSTSRTTNPFPVRCSSHRPSCLNKLLRVGLIHDCKWKILTEHLYTGAGHIIRISSKSWFISLIPFKKLNLYNVYIHSTQTDIFPVFISFHFDDYNRQLMKTPNSVSQKIRILLKTNIEPFHNIRIWGFH